MDAAGEPEKDVKGRIASALLAENFGITARSHDEIFFYLKLFGEGGARSAKVFDVVEGLLAGDSRGRTAIDRLKPEMFEADIFRANIACAMVRAVAANEDADYARAEDALVLVKRAVENIEFDKKILDRAVESGRMEAAEFTAAGKGSVFNLG